MERLGSLSVCALSTIALILWTARAQTSEVCDPDTKIPFPPEKQLDASTLLPLATIQVPESCGDFVFTQLVGCGGELIIKEGCCDQSCKDIFAAVPHDCVKDIAKVLCSMPDFKDFVHTLNHVAKRCDDDYKKVSCKKLAKSSSTKDADAKALDECTSDQKTPFEKKLTVDQLSPLVGTPLPATCEGFSPASLLSCQEDINFSDGCCNPECVDALKMVDSTCLLDFGAAMCTSSPDLVPFMANLARRCKEGFKAATCEDVMVFPLDGNQNNVNVDKQNGVKASNGQGDLASQGPSIVTPGPPRRPGSQIKAGSQVQNVTTASANSDGGPEDDMAGGDTLRVLCFGFLGLVAVSAIILI